MAKQGDDYISFSKVNQGMPLLVPVMRRVCYRNDINHTWRPGCKVISYNICTHAGLGKSCCQMAYNH